MRRARAPVRGFSLFELAIVLTIIGALATVLLNRLAYLQEMAEKAAMESALSGMKTGLQIRLAEMIIANRESEAATLELQDPSQWLAEARPPNYAGAYGPGRQRGAWYFDAPRRELVYVVNSGGRLEIDGEGAGKELRFRVRIVKAPVQLPGGAVQRTSGVTLAPVRPYRWR